MAYFEDLSTYTYIKGGDPQVVNIGWLDGQHDFPRGSPPEGFVDRLWIFCEVFVAATRGFHVCEVCQSPENSMLVYRKGEKELKLGHAEIRVIGKDRIYAAPNLIYHYVVDHQYLPPEEFIDAVLHGPEPGSEEYEKSRAKYGWRISAY